MFEEKKKWLKEYQKNYCEAKKSQYNNKIVFLIVISIVFQLRFNSVCYLAAHY